MGKIVNIACVQQRCVENRATNLQCSMEGIRHAAAQGAELVVLQELHGGLYFCQTEDPSFFDWAESIPGPTSEALGALAKELGVVIVACVFERRAAGIYHNTAVVLERDGGIAGTYRKMHIPDDPGYYEKFYFTPGDLGFEPIQTSAGKLGVLVCWDQWYPEAARLMALGGADILIYPTAIGWDPADTPQEQQRQQEAWITVQRAHAIANGLPMVACNRMGTEVDPSGQSKGIVFWGTSFIAGPQGEILAMAPGHARTDPGTDAHRPEADNHPFATDLVTTLKAGVDLARSETVRRNWPFLRDRRIDAYRDITKRYRDKHV